MQLSFPTIMYAPVITRDPGAVKIEVQAAYLGTFPDGDSHFVPQIFGWAVECFTGRYDDYQPIDAQYHDFEHTLQGTLCMARILKGRQRSEAKPVLPKRMFELGMIAILFHDTGYLKKRNDVAGTGAKYTVTHVRRSADFAAKFLSHQGYTHSEILSVQNMILCTGLNAALDKIPFQSEEERIAGFALGTADLLGQMAADDYVDKLPVLYAEFAEAAEHDHHRHKSVDMFKSAEDLMQKTPGFWQNYVRTKLDTDFAGLYQFLNDPYPNGRNYYLDLIDANMDRLRRQLGGKAGVGANG